MTASWSASIYEHQMQQRPFIHVCDGLSSSKVLSLWGCKLWRCCALRDEARMDLHFLTCMNPRSHEPTCPRRSIWMRFLGWMWLDFDECDMQSAVVHCVDERRGSAQFSGAKPLALSFIGCSCTTRRRRRAVRVHGLHDP